MLKDIQKNPPLLIGSSLVIVTLIGLAIASPHLLDSLEEYNRNKIEKLLQQQAKEESRVLPLVTLSPEERREKLTTLAIEDTLSLDRSRARYLLAADLLQEYEGGPALRQLEGLEKEYPVLAPYILLKQGRGYELTNEPTKATETWQLLVETYPESPVTAEALYKLAKTDPKYGDQAIKQFPNHPRTHDLVRQRLKEDSKNLDLLLFLATYQKNSPQTNQIRDQLVKEYGDQLTPENWQAIADGYWKTNLYKKAAEIYPKTPATPQNRYRGARSLQVSRQARASIPAYQALIKAFPEAPETATALKRLASLHLNPKVVAGGRSQALAYLDQIIEQFPEQAPDAIAEKIDIREKQGNRTAANQLKKNLLEKYPKSDASAKYRWKMSKIYADAGNEVKAWEWAQPISIHNVDSSVAPKAAFWVGKWARQLGQEEEATAAFRHVLAQHPESYYAWRSAVMLGWDVGDFGTARFGEPNIELPKERLTPVGSSPLFQELYLLGQDREAFTIFQAETNQKDELSVNEQFIKAIFKLKENHYLEGINLVWFLHKKEDPENQKQWQALRQTPDYWHALFPFPYADLTMKWAEQRQLDPLLVAALMRQESRFEKEIRSPAGALGLMQVMPATGAWIAPQIDLKDYSLTNPEDNVNMGTWYLDYTHREYRNNSMLAVASYNAGPGNVAKWMRRFQTQDPDIFVEKIPFRETKGYVEAVFGNYWNYRRIYDPTLQEQLSQVGKN
ncbi:MAG: transglycosylase SLT domain-containing protein [Microcystaceae cyanobacterium]